METYSYLEIYAAYHKLKFLRPDKDWQFIFGGTKRYTIIDGIPNRLFFLSGSHLIVQLHEVNKLSQVTDKWILVKSGRDDEFVFINTLKGPLQYLLRKERRYNLGQFTNAYS